MVASKIGDVGTDAPTGAIVDGGAPLAGWNSTIPGDKEARCSDHSGRAKCD